ncbi:MAG TPA: hypothetical protein VMN39_10250 [Longimicrobiaceae bacterium]|nr:hypothetical protein [Longimicrobiaceae bacterium]
MNQAASPSPRTRKFRQAAFVYLHVGLLYELSVYAFWRAGLLDGVPGHPIVWLLLGALIVAVVFWGLWFRESVWFARVIWAFHGLRLPALIEGAFLRTPGEGLVPPAFYLVAIFVILANLWMLARAGWDL